MNNVDWPGLVDDEQRQSHHIPTMNEATALTDDDKQRRRQQRWQRTKTKPTPATKNDASHATANKDQKQSEHC